MIKRYSYLIITGMIVMLLLGFRFTEPFGREVAPVSIGSDTAVFWLDQKESVSDQEIPFSDQLPFALLEDAVPEVDEETQRRPPLAGFELCYLNPETRSGGSPTVDTQIALLWTSPVVHTAWNLVGDTEQSVGEKEVHTYALDGKFVSELLFRQGEHGDSSLKPENLLAVTPYGIVLQFSSPGDYDIAYQVQDSEGLMSSPISVTLHVVSR